MRPGWRMRVLGTVTLAVVGLGIIALTTLEITATSSLLRSMRSVAQMPPVEASPLPSPEAPGVIVLPTPNVAMQTPVAAGELVLSAAYILREVIPWPFGEQGEPSYLIVGLAVRNRGPEARWFDPLYFKVVDATGAEYSLHAVASTLLPESLRSGRIGAEQVIAGQLAFELPATANGLTLVYEPPDLVEADTVLRIALEPPAET